MALGIVQLFALLPGIVFLGLGLRRVLSKVFKVGKLVFFPGSTDLSGGSTTSLLSFAVGVISIMVGTGWILVFLYFGRG